MQITPLILNWKTGTGRSWHGNLVNEQTATTTTMMNNLKAPSLHSLLDSDHGSAESLLAESLQLDIEEVARLFATFISAGLLTILF